MLSENDLAAIAWICMTIMIFISGCPLAWTVSGKNGLGCIAEFKKLNEGKTFVEGE